MADIEKIWDVICYSYNKAVKYKSDLEKEYGIDFSIKECCAFGINYYLVTPTKKIDQRGLL